MNPKEYDAMLTKLIREHALAVEALTEKQLVELLKQIIESGDIMRYVTGEGNKQALAYVPFAEADRLRNKVAELEQALAVYECML